MDKIRILYVDSEQNNLNAFTAYFRRKSHFEIVTSLTFDDSYLIEADFNIFIIDHSVIKSRGKDFCKKLRSVRTDAVKIVVTSFREVFALERYLTSGELFSFHCKPFDFEELGRAIENGYNRYFKQ